MPIYEYKCKKCGHRFDHLTRTLTDTARKCPKCGAPSPAKQFSTFTGAVSEGRDAASCPTCPTGTCSL